LIVSLLGRSLLDKQKIKRKRHLSVYSFQRAYINKKERREKNDT